MALTTEERDAVLRSPQLESFRRLLALQQLTVDSPEAEGACQSAARTVRLFSELVAQDLKHAHREFIHAIDAYHLEVRRLQDRKAA